LFNFIKLFIYLITQSIIYSLPIPLSIELFIHLLIYSLFQLNILTFYDLFIQNLFISFLLVYLCIYLFR